MGKTEKKVKCSPTGGSVADSPRALNIFDAAGFDAADKTHSCFSSHNVVRILSCHFIHRDIDCLKEQASIFFITGEASIDTWDGWIRRIQQVAMFTSRRQACAKVVATVAAGRWAADITTTDTTDRIAGSPFLQCVLDRPSLCTLWDVRVMVSITELVDD
eukprot:COSAG05_NODE_1814_length_4035_cov_1.312500_5_plen_160_part_00